MTIALKSVPQSTVLRVSLTKRVVHSQAGHCTACIPNQKAVTPTIIMMTEALNFETIEKFYTE